MFIIPVPRRRQIKLLSRKPEDADTKDVGRKMDGTVGWEQKRSLQLFELGYIAYKWQDEARSAANMAHAP